MSRAEARQTPVAEAGVLLAASKFREGWDVKGQNWREQEILEEAGEPLSESEREESGAGEALGVAPAKEPKNEGGKDQRSSDNDRQPPEEAALDVAVEPVPQPGQEETRGGTERGNHGGNLP